MHRVVVHSACFSLAGLLAASSATAGKQGTPPASARLDCVTVSAEARSDGYGYAHWVTVNNRCKRSVTCEVWTDVDPTPHLTVQASPGESASVITRRGSPAYAVRADGNCRYE